MIIGHQTAEQPHDCTILPACASPITGGTSGLGLALVRELLAAAPASPSSPAPRRRRARRRRTPGAHGIVGDVSQKDDIYPIAMQILGALGGLDVLVNNASILGPVPLALLADTECEDFERALATNVLGPFRLTKALLGALAASAREGRGAAGGQHLERRRDQRLPALGRVRREQGGAAPLSRDLERGAARPRASLSCRSTRATWTRRCTPLRCPTPIRSTLKRPEDCGARDRRRDRRALSCRSRRAGCRRGASMIAADAPDTARRADARLLVVDADGRMRTSAARATRATSCDRRSRDRQRCRDAAGEPVRRHVPSGAADRGAPGGPRLARRRRRQPLRRRAVRRRRLPDAHRGSAAAAALVRPAIGWRSARCARPSSALLDHPRLIALRFDGPPRRSGKASRGTDGRSSTRTSPQPLALWDTWTPIAGPPVAFEPPSAGFVLDWSALAAMTAARRRASPRSRTPPASRRPATRSWMRCCRSTSRTAFPQRTAAAMREARRRAAVGSSRSAPPSCGRWSTRRRATGSSAPATGWRPADRSVNELRVVDAILSGTHEPEPATTNCCGRLPTMRRWRGSRGSWKRRPIGRMSSGTRCSSRSSVERYSPITASARRTRRHEEHEAVVC